MDAPETPISETGDSQRLRRHLRALSTVNRQLQAQLEGGNVRVAHAAGRDAADARSTLMLRRLFPAGDWIEHLRRRGGGDPILIRTPTKGTHIVEGTMRRHVKHSILTAALTRALGPAREVHDRDLQKWVVGPPVEVMEGGSGPAFIVVGGRRLPLRGLPLPYLVTTEEMLLLPEGEELNIAAAQSSNSGRLLRARALVKREGVIRGGARLLRKAVRRLLRAKPKASA